jgi:hypothetical protein
MLYFLSAGKYVKANRFYGENHVDQKKNTAGTAAVPPLFEKCLRIFFRIRQRTLLAGILFHFFADHQLFFICPAGLFTFLCENSA